MRINHNIQALNTHRQLSGNTGAAGKSLEKLSSGFRINRAGDDAAGLAISEKMRAQIRGLETASRNAQDGISLIQTAEGALNETHSILQRMRELAVQASNGTYNDSDREALQKEMNQLSSEINRIGNTTEFNNMKVLRGDGSAPVTKGELSLGDSGLFVTPVTLAGGNITPATSAAVQLKIDDGDVKNTEFTVKFNGQDVKVKYLEDNENFDHGEMTVNDAGNEVTVYIKDGTKEETVARLTEEALKKAIEQNEDIDAADYNISLSGDSINISTVATGTGQKLEVTTSTKVFATNLNVAAGSAPAAPANAATTSTGTNLVRAYATGEVQFKLNDLKTEVLSSGVASTDTDYFNGADLTIDGLIKHLTGKGLTIGDETIEFFDGADGEYKGTADFAVDLNEIAWTTATGANNAAVDGDLDNLIAGIVEQVGSKMKNVQLSETATANDQKLKIDAIKAGAEGNAIKTTDGVDRPASDVVGSTFTAAFQIGANNGQSMSIQIGDMRSEALNVVGKAGEAHTTVEGAKFTAVNTVTNGTDNNEYIAALDISSSESATAAIEVINNAIEKVSAERSNMGAFQNRLEHTINNLGTTAENLTASESRIRDVDMAKEMMEFTKNNILSQAAQAMLAQANQQPQGVLQLLR